MGSRLCPNREGQTPVPPAGPELSTLPALRETSSGRQSAFFLGFCLLTPLSLLPLETPREFCSLNSHTRSSGKEESQVQAKRGRGCYHPMHHPSLRAHWLPVPPPENSPPQRTARTNPFPRHLYVWSRDTPSHQQGATTHAGSKRRVPRPPLGPVDKTTMTDYSVCHGCGKKRHVSEFLVYGQPRSCSHPAFTPCPHSRDAVACTRFRGQNEDVPPHRN